MEAYDVIKAQAEAVWRQWQDDARARVWVSMGSCSIGEGAEDTLAAVRESLALLKLDPDVRIVGCNGMCWAEPIVTIARPGEAGVSYGNVSKDVVPMLLGDVLVWGNRRAELALGVQSPLADLDGITPLSALEFFRIQERRLTARCGLTDPEDIDHYIATGGYQALDKALSSMGPEEIIKEVLDSGLTGRGGANFPCGRKWDFLRTAAETPKYMICNADEGDPGAFVNRILLESDPHLIIEGMLIGALATGATKGYIYIRDEYPLAVERMQVAVEQARVRGLLGKNILGSAFECDLEVVQGAGAYVCGEEFGLIQSIQDYRGMPRIKPPFPAQAGLWGKPTNVNNVETYACVPSIISNGASWFASMGTERAKGTKIFSLSGDVSRVCIVEVPLGFPLRTLLEVAGGGVPDGRALKAVQPGGPLGGFVPASLVDLPLEPGVFAQQGTVLGSGGLVFMDERACVVDVTKELIVFDRDESCARCTTCRIGSMRMLDILDRITHGEGETEDLEAIRELSQVMLNANCAHGQMTPGPVGASMRFFMEEYEAHILGKICPAKACPGLTEYRIDSARSAECEPFIGECPTGAMVKEGDNIVIDQGRCIKCGICAEVCPPGAVVAGSPKAVLPQPVG